LSEKPVLPSGLISEDTKGGAGCIRSGQAAIANVSETQTPSTSMAGILPIGLFGRKSSSYDGGLGTFSTLALSPTKLPWPDLSSGWVHTV